MKAFETGQKFEIMTMEDGTQFIVGDKPWDNESITCIMEAGEMAYVAWFVVKHKNGTETKVNGKYVRSIS